MRVLLLLALLAAPLAAHATWPFDDTFTEPGSSEDTVKNHTSDSGGGWQGASVSLNVRQTEDDLHSVASTGTLTGNIIDDAPGSADYWCSLDAEFNTSGSDSRWGIVLRADDTTSFNPLLSSYYRAQLQQSSGYTIWWVDNGTPSAQFAVDATFVADESIGTGDTVIMVFQVSTGTHPTFDLWFDTGSGMTQVETGVEDTSDHITAANFPGVIVRGGTSGPSPDNFHCETGTYTPPSASPVLPLHYYRSLQQ